MKNFRWTILAALLLAANGVAHAQAPVAPPSIAGGSGSSSSTTMSSSSSPNGGSAANNQDSGNINSLVGDTSVTTTETTTVTSSSGIGPDGVEIGLDGTDGGAMLADTGGEPIIMSLVGLMVAAGAFFMRRRVSA